MMGCWLIFQQILIAIDNNTIEYVTHFSHNGNPEQKRLIKLAKPLKMKVAFDGCKVKF